MATPVPQTEKAKRHRSPMYPGFNLQTAIRRVSEFYEKEHRNPASLKAAVSHWDYSEKSSAGLVAVAALKSFGLLDEVDSGAGRNFQISALGLKIVADKRPDSPEREAAVREAALRPKIHAEIWRKYNGRLPSDAELQYRLENEWHFNVNAIPSFIKELRETVAFAKLSESDGFKAASQGEEIAKVNIGDFVQWTSGGVDQFTRLRRVVQFSEDGKFAFVEGERTGLPMDELTIGEAPAQPALPRKPIIQDGATNTRNEVFSLDDGGEVVITWPSPLPPAAIEDIKEWLRIVERKIARSGAAQPTKGDEE